VISGVPYSGAWLSGLTIVEGYMNPNLQNFFLQVSYFWFFVASVVFAGTVDHRAQQRGVPGGWQ